MKSVIAVLLGITCVLQGGRGIPTPITTSPPVTSTPVLGQICLSCDDVIRPEDCNLPRLCHEDQICYTEHIYINKEKRFRMGCAQKYRCKVESNSTGSVAPVVGKRDTAMSFVDRYRKTLPGGEYCAKCCSGNYCNRDLCTTRQALNEFTLVIPPPLDFCQDYEESSCRHELALNPMICNDQAIKRLFCPRTCNTCSGGGMSLLTTTPSLVTSTSAMGDSCKDGKNCAHYADFFCSPSNPSGQDVCPITCRNPRCVGGGGIPLPTATPSVGGSVPLLTTIILSVTSTSVSMDNCTDGKNCAHYADFFCSPSNPSGQDICPITCKNPRCVAPTLSCVDSIQKCQCEYLDKSLQICQDGDPELQKFCCFYCKKANNPTWTCNQQDKLYCTGKEQDFANEIHATGLNITCITK